MAFYEGSPQVAPAEASANAIDTPNLNRDQPDEHNETGQPIDPEPLSDAEGVRLSVTGTNAAGERLQEQATFGASSCLILENACVPLTLMDGCHAAEDLIDIVVLSGRIEATSCTTPPDKATYIIAATAGNAIVNQSSNNVSATFNHGPGEDAVGGNFVVDGNGVSVVGHGTDTTIIGGNVSLRGNGVRLRDVTIRGNLEVTRNNVSVQRVSVGGNLIVRGEGSAVTRTVVFGNLVVEGGGHLLVDNQVKGNALIEHPQNACALNTRFTDMPLTSAQREQASTVLCTPP